MNIKCIAFDKQAQDALPEEIKAKMKADREKAIMDTETLTVLQKGENFEIIVEHDQSGSAYGITLSKNAYEQLRQHFVVGRSTNKKDKNPCLKHYELFELMHDEHGLLLLESELNEIVSVVKKTDKGLNELRDEAYETAKSKGFHENKQVDIPRSLMLIVSEISEALEADRKGRWARLDHFDLYMYGVVDEDHEEQFIKHFEAEIKDSPEDELADAIIRILDLCGALNIDIEEHVALKMKYNKTREKLHGKKY